MGLQPLWVRGSEESVGMWDSEKWPTEEPSDMMDTPLEGCRREFSSISFLMVLLDMTQGESSGVSCQHPAVRVKVCLWTQEHHA